jgi:hypothetical protein
MPTESLGRWIARIFLWLVPCFAVWHFASGSVAALQAWIAGVAAGSWFPGLVSGWERTDATIDFVTRLTAVVDGRPGEVLVSVNARLYSYGLPLFAALCLATGWRRWPGLAAGLAALAAVAGIGVGFELLRDVFALHGAAALRDFAPTAFERHAIALGYQAASLLSPTLLPVLAWGIVHRDFLGRWAGRI